MWSFTSYAQNEQHYWLELDKVHSRNQTQIHFISSITLQNWKNEIKEKGPLDVLTKHPQHVGVIPWSSGCGFADVAAGVVLLHIGDQ